MPPPPTKKIAANAAVVNAKMKGVRAKGNRSLTEKQKRSSSVRAGIIFPVGRVDRQLRRLAPNGARMGKAASVYLAAVLEYLVGEVLDVAGECCTQSKHKRVVPRDVRLSVSNDLDLKTLFQQIDMLYSGVVPHQMLSLVPTKKGQPTRNSKFWLIASCLPPDPKRADLVARYECADRDKMALRKARRRHPGPETMAIAAA